MAGPEPPDSTTPSLRRELYAVLVLYACIAILPLLIGLAFGQ